MKAILMKLAVLVFLSSASNAGEILNPKLVPYDQALKEFKERTTSKEVPAFAVENGYDTMQIWTQRGGAVKSHRFDLATVKVEAPQADAVTDLVAAIDPAAIDPAAIVTPDTVIDPAMVTDPPTVVDPGLPAPLDINPATLASYDIHPTGVSPSATENGSPNDATAVDTASDPPSTTEVSSAPKPKKRH